MIAYVAAPLALWQKARMEMDMLRQLGLGVAHDWTQGAEAYFKGGCSPVESNEDIATSCIEAVRASDFVLALLDPMVPTQGVWCEIGAALALGKQVLGYLPAVNEGILDSAYSQNEAAILRAELEGQRAREWRRRASFLDHPLCFVSGSYTSIYKQIELMKGKAK